MSPYFKKRSKSFWIYQWSPILKMVAVLLMLCVPIVVIMMVFTPLAIKKNTQEVEEQYSLPENFVKDDVISIVNKMKQDQEFAFYFYTLKPKAIERITQEVFVILDENRKQDLLNKKLREVTEEVVQLSILFLHLEYDDEFVKNPSQFPELNQTLWKFLEEEFKLTILGLCYKVNHDKHFSFQWGPSAKLAAQKLQSIIAQTKSQQK